MKKKLIVLLCLLSLIICNCTRKYGDFYDPPTGQQSVIYDQLASDPRFSTFVSAIDTVPGLKNELSSSGLFTIMAPDNTAFSKYFENHPTYKSVYDIPRDSLILMVKYHIMKWMLFQVNFLNPGLTKDNFKAFKYETRANLTYNELSLGGGTKAIYYPSKMVQVYTPNFFRLYNVTAQDYTDVYGTGSSIAAESQLNIMGATVTQKDLASGNGVIHVIDNVLEPPPTIAQIFDKNPEYSEFTQLMKRRYLFYTYNRSATIAQGNNGDINGDGLVDSLWTRNYAIDPYIDNEDPLVPGTSDALSITGFAPSRPAFLNYLTNRLAAGFLNSVDSIPNRTLTLFYQSYFSPNMYWPSQIDARKATNLLGNTIVLARSDIKKIKMASNGLFYELNKVIEPDAFSSVPGPAFLSSDYWYFAEMLIETGSLSGLTKAGTKYTILCPTNQAFKNYGIYWDYNPGGTLNPGFFKRVGAAKTALTVKELAPLVGNHIIINYDLPASGIADGFYPTMNSSFITVAGGEIHGSVRDTIPQIIDPDHHMSNGYFQGINRTIIDPQQSLFDLINYIDGVSAPGRPEYDKFRELCIAAGILSKDFLGITNVDAEKKFTLFVPSNDAITAAQVAGLLPKTGAVKPNTTITTTIAARLESYIRYFFVQEIQALTDGKVTGTFMTSKKDPISTPTNAVYIPASVTYPGGILTFNEIGTSIKGKVDITNPSLYPQNTIARDGIIQIIDNAFTSKY